MNDDDLHYPIGALNVMQGQRQDMMEQIAGGQMDIRNCDHNQIQINELQIKHAEARRKIGYLARRQNLNQKMDAKSILSRAQKVILKNIDQVNNILPREKVCINAFGIVDKEENFNYIPEEMYEALETFQINQ